VGYAETTCWTLIRAARAGEREGREEFVRCYTAPVDAYLRARWRGSPLASEVPDACQEVFLECFRQDGVLDHVEEGRPGGFRAYLFGVVRNVARAEERRWIRRSGPQDEQAFELAALRSDPDGPSRAFDRAWARAMLREAATLMRLRAESQGGDGTLRVELLREHVCNGLSIRELARRWDIDCNALQRRYAQARSEFERAVRDTLATHVGNDPDTLAREWEALHGLVP